MAESTSRLKSISFGDLPKYSDWPKKLLSLETFEVKEKTKEEVLREFEDEKWGKLLEHVRMLEKPSLSEVDQLFGYSSKNLHPFFYKDEFYLASMMQMMEKHIDLYAQILRPHLDGASCLIELGAGYGSKLFNLGQRDGFKSIPLVAGEFAESGRKLISILADSLGRTVDVGYCDFRKLEIYDMSIPENAVIFTSYAAHYVPELPMDFVKFLADYNPKAVIHFEPCYEHYSMDTIYGMMCRRYVQLNDYTRNLVSVINAYHDKNQIDVRMQENVIGSNPLLPISIIEWSSKRKG